jgi:membrane protein DedA with SNARE-associated domain
VSPIDYLPFVLVVFGVNLLPAFGPPTWTLVVFAHVHWHLNPVALVLTGAAAAAAGRYLLATGTRHFGGRLPATVQDNLQAADEYLAQRRRSMWLLFGVFVVSPLPSAQMFEAAGLLDLNLKTVTLAFFFGRTISYSIYLAIATVAQNQFGDLFTSFFGATWSIVIEVVMIVLVVALPMVPWRRIIASRRAK